EGVITAVSPGVVIVSASASGKSGNTTIEVRASPPPGFKSVTISPEQWTATQVGTRYTFAVEVINDDDQEVIDAPVTWTSSDPTVASVDAQGEVTALKAGAVTITARAGIRESTARVDVDLTGALSGGVVWTVYPALTVESP